MSYPFASKAPAEPRATVTKAPGGVCQCPGLGIIVDCFAGAGGAGLGIKMAMVCDLCGLHREVTESINHNEHALFWNALNCGSRKWCEDIANAEPLIVTEGRPVQLLWLSPDCTHFSKARGGKPVTKQVRGLAWQAVRWASEVRPEVICMENVEEFLTWGPIEEYHTLDGCHGGRPTKSGCLKGCRMNQPIKALAGTIFRRWIASLRALGYSVDYRTLTASEFGSPTSRKRWFLVARRDGAEITWPTPTHGDAPLQPKRSAAECIDWTDRGESIFGRVRADGVTDDSLCENTMKRIAKGLQKYVLNAGQNGESLYIVPNAWMTHSGNGEREGQTPRTYDITKPHPTVVAGGGKTRLCTAWIVKNNTDVTGTNAAAPLDTVTTRNSQGVAVVSLDGREDKGPLVAAFFQSYYGKSSCQSAWKPLRTITTRDRHGLITVEIDGKSHTITDITTRMLKPSELALAQGFPRSYKLPTAKGTKTIANRLIGNSVPPQLAAAVVRHQFTTTTEN